MKRPWTNVYGVARSLLAFGLLSQLLFNSLDVLFRPERFGTLVTAVPASRFSLFYLLSGSRTELELARWIAIVVLTVVASGWRPRFTSVLHWWIAFSFAITTAVPEGGDQIGAILALLLIPVCLTDSRSWHWQTTLLTTNSAAEGIRSVVASSSLTVIRIQVALIYFWSGVAKLSTTEWADGTAVYYWLIHPVYGMNDWIRPVAVPLLTNSVIVTVLTWGAIALELLMASALVMDRRWYQRLLIPGLAFHASIILAHGLFSFFFAMAGALTLYLRPFDRPFSLVRVRTGMALIRTGANPKGGERVEAA